MINKNFGITTDLSVFKKINAPKYDTGSKFSEELNDFDMPKLELGKTYYLVDNNDIKAFRVLAMAVVVTRNYYKGNKLVCLIQFPNEEPKWTNILSYGTICLENKNDYEDYILNPTKYKLEWEKKINLFSTTNDYTYIWENSAVQNKSAIIEYILYTQSGFLIGVGEYSFGGHKIYTNKTQCITENVKKTKITDFEDSPSINIKLEVTKSYTTTLHITEM